MVNEMTDVSTPRNHKQKTWTKEKEENKGCGNHECGSK